MFSFFIGIDVSKDTIDVSFTDSGIIHYLGNYTNCLDGFVTLIKHLKSKTALDINNWFFCFEHTGVYSYELLMFLQDHDIPCLEESALRINKSLGLKRGKNDKADSKDICLYAFEKRATLKLSIPMSTVVSNVKRLVLRRDLLVNYLKALKASYKATILMSDENLIPLFDSHQQELVAIYKKQIKELEKQIKIEISKDPVVKQNDELAQSVIGIGPIISAFLIAYTNNYNYINDGRKFASYVGIAPFENSSGLYKGKSKTSNLANKKLKSLLSNAVLSALKYDGQLANYKSRKLEENKEKGIIVNNIKNKIVHRVFAVIKRQTPYVKLNYA